MSLITGRLGDAHFRDARRHTRSAASQRDHGAVTRAWLLWDRGRLRTVAETAYGWYVGDCVESPTGPGTLPDPAVKIDWSATARNLAAMAPQRSMRRFSSPTRRRRGRFPLLPVHVRLLDRAEPPDAPWSAGGVTERTGDA